MLDQGQILSINLGTIGVILAAMAVVGLIEIVTPLRARTTANGFHLAPNMALTFITFATNLGMNIAVILGLAWAQANEFGVLNQLHVGPIWHALIVVMVLDLSFYVAHVSMHKIAMFWRFHAVHHSDPAVDVTTTIRQHPGEGAIRYIYLALFAIPLGASLPAFAIYRLASVINGLLEHANIRLPRWLDRMLSWLTTWPNLHKVHHSRDQSLTETNYGNLFSLWDRLFGTFTPSRFGAAVEYGLSGTDQASEQTTAALLAAPFRRTATHAPVAASDTALRRPAR